jgi:outer membrane lipoprotein carrier protein LolA
MISGIAALIPLLLAANPPSAPIAAPDVAALIARLARPAPDDTAYAEVRFVGMLKQPLVLHGELHYGGAGKLGKRVDTPYRETTTIADDTVEVQRADMPTQRFSLDRAPELQTLLAAFGALLGGDAATLTKYYRIDATQAGSDFSLRLTARAARAGKLNRVVVSVDGSGDEPRCFSLYQPDGDASVMLLGTLAGASLPDPPTRPALEQLCHRLTP